MATTDPQPNVLGMPTPTAQPAVTNDSNLVGNTPTSNPAIQMTDDQIQAKLKQMNEQVNAQAPQPTAVQPNQVTPAPSPAPTVSAPVQEQTIQQSQQQPGAIISAPTGQNTPTQVGTEPQQQTFQAMTGNQNQDLAWAASQRTGKPASQITAQDLAFQQEMATRSTSTPTNKPMEGVVYDPASNTFRDPRTLNYFQGLTQSGTPIFSAVQETAIQAAFGTLDSGIITTDSYRQATDLLGSALTTAKTSTFKVPTANQINDPTGFGSSTNDTLKFLNNQMAAGLLNEQQSMQSDAARVLSDQAAQIGEMLKNPNLDPEYASILAQQKSLLESKQNALADIGNAFDDMVTQQTRSNDLALKKAMAASNAAGQVGSMLADANLNAVIKSNEEALRDIGTQRLKAIRDAETAYREQDLQLTFEKLKRVQTLQDKYTELQFQGAQMKEQYADRMFDRQMKMVSFQQQLEEYADTKSAREEERYLKSVSNWAMTGAEPDENQKLFFKQQEKQFGLPSGYTEAVLGAQKQVQQAKSVQDQVAASKAIYEILDKVPAGQMVSIAGNNYFGTQGAGKIEIDEKGIGRMMVVDQATGDIRVKSLGKMGKAESDSYSVQYDEVTGEAFIFNNKTGQFVNGGSDYQVADRWQEMLPDGAKGGQCGAFVNDLTGLGVGNSLESKIVKCDPKLLKNPSLLEVGDTFVQSTNKPWGHIGIINAIDTLPNGRVQLTLTESNWNGDERISNTRTMYADDPRLKGFAKTANKLPEEMISESYDPRTDTQIRLRSGGDRPRKLSADEKAEKDLQRDLQRTALIEKLKAEINAPKEQAEANQKANDKAFERGDKFRLDPTVKSNVEIKRQYSVMESALARMEENLRNGKSISTQDQTIITTFNKILDPTSVVREGEYARTAEGQSLLDRLQGKLQQISKGGSGSTPDVLRETAQMAQQFMIRSERAFQERVRGEIEEARIAKLDPRLIVGVSNSPVIKAVGNDGQVYEVSPEDDEYYQAFTTGKVTIK